MHCQTEYPSYTANHSLISGMRDMSKSLHPSKLYPDNRELDQGDTLFLIHKAKVCLFCPCPKACETRLDAGTLCRSCLISILRTFWGVQYRVAGTALCGLLSLLQNTASVTVPAQECRGSGQ